MPLTVQFYEGDGVNDDKYDLAIQIPDGNGGTANVSGGITPAGQALVPVNGTCSIPAAPGSGSIFFNIQVDTGNAGAVALLQSTVSAPAVQNGTSRIVYSGTLSPTTTSDSGQIAGVTPDPPAGGP